jgi:tetratricopeptide (TPR) repeat protein
MSNHSISYSLLIAPAKKIVMKFFLPGLAILLFTACSSMPMMKPATESRGLDETGDGQSGGELDGAIVAGPQDSSLRSLEPSRKVPAHAARLFRKAIKALEDKRYDRAEPILDELIVLLPDFSSLHTNLGIVYANTSRTEMALASLNRAVELRPDDCVPRVQIGLLERQLRNFQSAEKTYLDCVHGDPNYAPAYLNLGILYELYMGLLPEALSAYEKHQALSPNKRVASWVKDLHRRVDTDKQLAVGAVAR